MWSVSYPISQSERNQACCMLVVCVCVCNMCYIMTIYEIDDSLWAWLSYRSKINEKKNRVNLVKLVTFKRVNELDELQPHKIWFQKKRVRTSENIPVEWIDAFRMNSECGPLFWTACSHHSIDLKTEAVPHKPQQIQISRENKHRQTQTANKSIKTMENWKLMTNRMDRCDLNAAWTRICCRLTLTGIAYVPLAAHTAFVRVGIRSIWKMCDKNCWLFYSGFVSGRCVCMRCMTWTGFIVFVILPGDLLQIGYSICVHLNRLCFCQNHSNNSVERQIVFIWISYASECDWGKGRNAHRNTGIEVNRMYKTKKLHTKQRNRLEIGIASKSLWIIIIQANNVLMCAERWVGMARRQNHQNYTRR